MAFQGIGTALVPSEGTVDSLYTGAVKINSNFQELYSALGGSGGTIPVTLSISGSRLIFNVSGIGSTSFNLS